LIKAFKKSSKSINYIESLRGKRATFMLALANSKTANIKGISQAGIDGLLHLTPTLDCEFLATGSIFSIDEIAKTDSGIPSPALITRAIHELNPFNLEFLDLGIEKKPKIEYFDIFDFKLKPSDRIDENAKIDSRSIFEKAINFANDYELKSDYLIVAETIPSGTTTAEASAKALGYDTKGLYASSFSKAPKDIKRKTIDRALLNISNDLDVFDRLSSVSDNMLIFYAGFIIGLSKKCRVILAGGTQLATVLLIINSILKEDKFTFSPENLALITTKWIYEDKHSDIEALLELLDFEVFGYYSDFDFSKSRFDILKKYDSGEAKEGVGAGGALGYASLNGISNESILESIENILERF